MACRQHRARAGYTRLPLSRHAGRSHPLTSVPPSPCSAAQRNHHHDRDWRRRAGASAARGDCDAQTRAACHASRLSRTTEAVATAGRGLGRGTVPLGHLGAFLEMDHGHHIAMRSHLVAGRQGMYGCVQMIGASGASARCRTSGRERRQRQVWPHTTGKCRPVAALGLRVRLASTGCGARGTLCCGQPEPRRRRFRRACRWRT